MTALNRFKGLLPLLMTLIVLVVIIFLARHFFGIELSQESLNNRIESMGAAAPVAAVLLVAFRTFLGIPSHLVLLVVGILFGTVYGTLYGTIGLTISGVLVFLLARFGGRDYVQEKVPKRLAIVLENAGNRFGAMLTILFTGHPLGLLTPVHAFMGITAIPFILFLVSLVIGAIFRSACYAYFGDIISTREVAKIIPAALMMLVVLCLPLLSPTVRAWLRPQ